MNRDNSVLFPWSASEQKRRRGHPGGGRAPVLIGVAALSVDVAYVFSAQRALQASTDAAALAGAQVIGTGGSVVTTVTTYSATGKPKRQYQT